MVFNLIITYFKLINPDDPDIYFALGKSYYKLNKRKKARETLDILYMLDRDLYKLLSIKISVN